MGPAQHVKRPQPLAHSNHSSEEPKSRMFRHISLSLLLAAGATTAEKCQHPPPSENYSNQLYAGQWFEVGKYQTIGGAIFQIGTVCTEANFSPYGDVGDGDIGYSSRRDTPDGEMVNATGVLEELDAPGHFSQTLEFFGFGGPPTDYNVIYIDEDSAIEYDSRASVWNCGLLCPLYVPHTHHATREASHASGNGVGDGT